MRTDKREQQSPVSVCIKKTSIKEGGGGGGQDVCIKTSTKRDYDQNEANTSQLLPFIPTPCACSKNVVLSWSWKSELFRFRQGKDGQFFDYV